MCLNIERVLVSMVMATNYDLSVFVNYCSVLLGDTAVPRKWSGGAGVPGSAGLQCSLCHHCLLVSCFWGKQVVTWLDLSNLIGQLVTWLDLNNLIGQLLTLFNKQMVAWSPAFGLGQVSIFTSSPRNRDVAAFFPYSLWQLEVVFLRSSATSMV